MKQIVFKVTLFYARSHKLGIKMISSEQKFNFFGTRVPEDIKLFGAKPLIISSAFACFACVSLPPDTAGPALDASSDVQSSDFDLSEVSFEDPIAEYSPFQWSLWHGGNLVLAEEGGFLYPATVVPGKVLESYPPQMSISFMDSGQQSNRRIGDLVSVTSLNPQEWSLQVKRDGVWGESTSFTFDGQRFTLSDGAVLPVSKISSIRFVAAAKG
ncbi:MAG: hypothetical protein AAF996_04785 [Pseudomonadota bacterium]